MLKKLLTFLVPALLTAVTASANGEVVDGIYYIFSGTNATVTYTCDAMPSADGQNAYTGDIVIPPTVNFGGTDYTVTEIGEGAFCRSTITSVVIPEGVTLINNQAFCRSTLTSVTIPNSVTTIKGDAFAYSSSLKVVTIGESVDAISQGFCWGSGVTDVYSNIAGTVHSQAAYMFPDNARIHVPANRVSDYTAKWTSFNIVADYDGVYYSFKGTEAIATYPGNKDEAQADKTAVYTGDIVIPSTIDINGTSYTVTTIGDNAFSHSAITSLEIPNSVTKIEGDAAAYIGATLATVKVGSGVTSISQGFCFSTNPTDVYIYTVSVPSGANYLFSGTPTIHVYDFIKADFEAAQYWEDYTFAGDLPADYDAVLAKATEAQGYLDYVGTAPGYYSAEAYEPIDDALANFVMLDPSSPASAINASMSELSDAIESFLASTPNPLTEGYYCFKSYYRETQFIYSDASSATTHGLKLKTINAANPGTDKTCYFKLIKNGDDWNIQCADNGKYWASLSGGSSTTTTGKFVLLTDAPECTQTITRTGVGLFKIQTIYKGGLTRPLSNYSSDLSTQYYSETSADFKRSQWYICPADEDMFALHMLVEAAEESLNTITPKDHHDNKASLNRSFLLGNERTSIDGLATSTEHLAELQTAYDAAVAALAEGKEKKDVPDIYNALAAAKAKVDAKSNPLVDGYYHLIAEYDYQTDGVPGGFVIEADGDGIKKIAYNANEPKQMFKVEYDAANGKVYLQNVANGKYLGVVDGSAWKFSDDRISLNVMTGNDHNWYWGDDQTVAARSCSFILSDEAGKGISSANCGVRNDVTNTSTEAWFESWAFRPADEYYADYIANGPLKTAIENFADTYANLEYGTNPGEYAQAGVEAFQNLYASDVTAYNGGNNTLTIAEQQAMADALSAAYQTAINTRIPLTDGYYVIKSAASAFGDNEYAMYIDDNAKVAWKAYDAAAPGEFIFQLTDQNATVTPDGVTYEVFSYYNVAQKKYIGQCSTQMANEDASTSDEVWGACAQVLTPAGQFTIQPMWNPTTVSFCLTVDNTSNTSGIVRTSGWYGGYSGGNNNGSWKFEKVDLEAVTIGETGYSTFVSDKALVIPTGVTAYGVTGIDGTEVELTQLSGSVLAANEPVILAGEAGTSYFLLASDDTGSSIAGNLLEGTGTTGKSIGENEAYVLYNNEGTAVFRIAGAMTLPAYKAYLPAAVVGGAGAKEYTLGGLTGINNAQTSNLESQTYFDLQG
ncbi:MAG: leucine-rich repeat protein, partial [Bacteroidaceae bacterium]|nr:leucine-rich repeat protein [Bacteroidaceae bacterium]